MKYFIVMTGSRSHKPIGNPLVPRTLRRAWRLRFFRSKASAEVIRPRLHAVRIDKESLRPQRFCFLYTVDLDSHFLMLPPIKESYVSKLGSRAGILPSKLLAIARHYFESQRNFLIYRTFKR